MELEEFADESLDTTEMVQGVLNLRAALRRSPLGGPIGRLPSPCEETQKRQLCE